jgi:hypothetical protein
MTLAMPFDRVRMGWQASNRVPAERDQDIGRR